MPWRLALRLMIAWLAWVPMVSAQQPGPQGFMDPGFHGMPPAGPYSGQPRTVDHPFQPTLQEQLVPGSRGGFYGEDPLLDLGLADTLSSMWVRTDYLLLSYRNPDSRFLGATPLVVPPAVFNPNATFPAIDRVTGVRLGQSGRLMTLDNANRNDNNGLKVTVGIPTQLFTLEGSSFYMANSENPLAFPAFNDVNAVLPTLVIPAIPLTRDGLPSAIDYILFDGGANVQFSSEVQGADAKLVLGAITPNTGFDVLPLVGFNYLHYGNHLSITGDDAGSGTSHSITSAAQNHIFGPELGLRMESRGQWLTLGLEPKLTLGINRMSNRVTTSQIFATGVDPITLLPLEPDQLSKDHLSRFSPMIDLASYARLNLSENLQLSFGYQFTAIANVSQSERNIVWNSSSTLTDPPLIRVQRSHSTFWMSGINLGLNWQF